MCTAVESTGEQWRMALSWLLGANVPTATRARKRRSACARVRSAAAQQRSCGSDHHPRLGHRPTPFYCPGGKEMGEKRPRYHVVGSSPARDLAKAKAARRRPGDAPKLGLGSVPSFEEHTAGGAATDGGAWTPRAVRIIERGVAFRVCEDLARPARVSPWPTRLGPGSSWAWRLRASAPSRPTQDGGLAAPYGQPEPERGASVPHCRPGR